MNYPNFNEEKKLRQQGYKLVAGIDEAGRGPLAGPVVAAAVIVRNLKFQILNFKSNPNFKNIKDSKKMTAEQRENAYEFLTKHSDIIFGVGIVSEKVIDKINILQATKLAMLKSVKNLNPDFLILDGNFLIQKKSDKKYILQKSIIKGDTKVMSIAMASIIAKVTRDKIMQKYHKKYSDYGFGEHKGYGTKVHYANLEKFGPCKIHRKTFCLGSKKKNQH
jgi:ribonuclease HII